MERLRIAGAGAIGRRSDEWIAAGNVCSLGRTGHADPAHDMLVTIDDGHLFLVTSAAKSAAIISDFLNER